MLNLKIEKKDYRHLSHQIREQIRNLIENNHFQENEVLPPVSWFRKSLDVSQNPIRKALLELRDEGLVYSKKGSGWYVGKKTAETFAGAGDQIMDNNLDHLPLPFIIKKRTVKIALTDHPAQAPMWRKIFDCFEERENYAKIEIEPAPGKADIHQTLYRRIENKSDYENLLEFRSIQQVDFADIFEVFLKTIKTPDFLLGLPSAICLPQIYVHRKWAGEFSDVIKKERISWNVYFKSLLSVSDAHPEIKNGFVLSHLSPLNYFIVNGKYPFESRAGEVKTHFEDPAVISVLRHLEIMGRRKIYTERGNDQKHLDDQRRFIKGFLPIIEGYSFYKYHFAAEKVTYRVMPFPCSSEGKVPMNCSYWAIPATAREKDLSAEIIGYLMSKEAQEIIAGFNTLPVLKSVAYSDKFSPYEYEHKRIQISILEYGEDLSGRDEIFYDYLGKHFNLEVNKLINRLQTCDETIENLKKYAEEMNKKGGGN